MAALDAENIDGSPAFDPPSALQVDAETGRRFSALLSRARFLTIFWDGDAENPLFSMSWTDRQDHRSTVTAQTPESLLAAAVGAPDRKRCLKCEKVKHVGEFPLNKNEPGGRWRYCARCERQRVAFYRRTKEQDEREAKKRKKP